jgi:hypothetical protein
MGTGLPVTGTIVGLVASLAGCASDDGDELSPYAVNVIVHDADHRPVTGAAVIGRGDSGEEWPANVTDADGLARMFTAEDGTITIANEARTQWHSFASVGPGDVVRVVIQPGQLPDKVVLTVPPAPSGGSYSNAGARCARVVGFNGPELDVDRWCAGDAPTTVVLSTDDRYQWPEYFLVAENVELGGTSATLEGSWEPASRMAMFDMGRAGTGMAWQSVRRTVLDDGYPIFTTAPGWAVTSPMPIPSPNVGDGAAFGVTTSDGRDYVEAASDPMRMAIDEEKLLPAIGNLVIESETVRWTGGGGGDAVSATIHVRPAVGPEWSWTVTAPAGVQSVRFPDIADRPWPASANEVVNGVEIEEMESSLFASYDEAIAFDDWIDDTLPVPMNVGTYVRTSRATTAP